MKTADQATTNWVAAMGSVSTQTNYKAGIQNYGGNPMALAASPAAEQAYLDGVQRSVTSGKRQASLNSASPIDWKNNAVTFGAGKLGSGAQKAKSKYQRKIAPFAAVWPQMRAAARALPKGGIANAQARAAAALEVLMRAAGYAA